MDISFTGFGITTTIYTAPTKRQTPITSWKGKHSGWKSGFVVRFYRLGFILRWNKVPKLKASRRWTKLDDMIQQANDGDYVTDEDRRRWGIE